MRIDLHAHFPVHGYAGLDRDALDPAAHSGVWVQPGFRLSMRPIDWEMLNAHRVDCEVAGGRVSVPRPELLAIILSAHGFMNFTNVWSISHRDKPYVRLGELADLRDLFTDVRFDPDLFARLVHDLDATSAEIGFTLARIAQGRGVATAAVRMLVELIFKCSAAERVIGITDARNLPSMRLMERVGMQRTETRQTIFRGEVCVEHTYIVTRAGA